MWPNFFPGQTEIARRPQQCFRKFKFNKTSNDCGGTWSLFYTIGRLPLLAADTLSRTNYKNIMWFLKHGTVSALWCRTGPRVQIYQSSVLTVGEVLHPACVALLAGPHLRGGAAAPHDLVQALQLLLQLARVAVLRVCTTTTVRISFAIWAVEYDNKIGKM